MHVAINHILKSKITVNAKVCTPFEQSSLKNSKDPKKVINVVFNSHYSRKLRLEFLYG